MTIFVYIFWINIWKFESVLIPYKFNVLSLKMIKISNHNQKLIFKSFMFSCIIFFFKKNTLYMYIIPHLCVVKNFWKFKILDQFWKILWIFKVLQLHMF